jgi:two-component system, chemotaxis family, sensor kinase Cph1
MNKQQHKKNYDSEFCGNLPLHLVNLVQPYGVLVILDHDLNIVQVSENADKIFSRKPAAIVETRLDEYLPASQVEALRARIAEGITGKVQFNLTFSVEGVKNQFGVLVHHKPDYLILEIENRPKAEQS